MERKIKVLFICVGNSCRSQMAEGFGRALGGGRVEAYSAGLDPRPVHPLTVEVMREAGVDISAQRSKALDQALPHTMDAVITMFREDEAACPPLPGHLPVVHWHLPDPAKALGEREEVWRVFVEVRDTVKRLVSDLLEHGILDALVRAGRNVALALDNISEGVLAHDTRRRIFYFNAAAERITGYSREEVLNRDCYDVFPGGLCGGKCSFCEDGAPFPLNTEKDFELIAKNGEPRRVSMTVREYADPEGRQQGVVACFRDVTREVSLARRLGEVEHFSGIIGKDPKILALFELIPDLAQSAVPILIQGESGTGKELIAAALHNEGPRASRRFVPVNCGALPEGLLESELFGHVKGAFTGAVRDKKGRFELADGGTIFLDEIGDISPAMQTKLLRVLQEGCFERVGGETTIRVDVRVISATNKDLAREMASGRFREDLFYRLSVVPITIPPLRERRADIPVLARHFLERAARETGREGMRFSDEAMDFLLTYSWPGNVRELQNWIQFALIKCKGAVIKPEHLPPVALRRAVETQSAPAGQAMLAAGMGREGPRRLDEAAVREALQSCSGNRVRAARALGVSRATLYRFLAAHPSLR